MSSATPSVPPVTAERSAEKDPLKAFEAWLLGADGGAPQVRQVLAWASPDLVPQIREALVVSWMSGCIYQSERSTREAVAAIQNIGVCS